MKALLICPDERKGVAGLSGSVPLSNVPILGHSLLEHWLAQLVTLGAREVLVLAVDRPDQVRALVGDGARWGLRVSVQTEKRELTLEEARAKHQTGLAAWLAAPNDIIVLDHLPSLPQLPLFTSYADWFAAARALLPQAVTPDRVGVRELQPGVWVGLHAHVPAEAKLIPPCWIEERVWIEAGAVIGPNVVLEREVVVSRGAEIAESVVGPQTCVGQFTEIHNSIAWGSTLVNWERDSCVKVTDDFLLCPLHPHPAPPVLSKTPSLHRLREYVSQLLTSVFAETGPPR